jgi:hypothetical protein
LLVDPYRYYKPWVITPLLIGVPKADFAGFEKKKTD